MDLSQSMQELVPIKTLFSEVITLVDQDTVRLEFINHSTVFEDNYLVVKVTYNHKFPVMNPRYNHTSAKYHWFREKITSGECYVKNVDGKDQKVNIFTKGIQGDIFLHIYIFNRWYIQEVG